MSELHIKLTFIHQTVNFSNSSPLDMIKGMKQFMGRLQSLQINNFVLSENTHSD